MAKIPAKEENRAHASLGLLIVATIASLFLSGCTTPQNNYRPEATETSTPPLDTVNVAQIGDELLRQGKYYEGEGILLSEPIKFGLLGAYTLMPGEYRKTGEDKSQGFYLPAATPKGGAVKKALLSDPWESIAFRESKNQLRIVTVFHVSIGADAKGVTRIKLPVLADDAFQQTLIYSGKVGTKIKLGYREFSNSLARPAFNNDVEYDLSESKIVGYKGARLEILEATNEFIRYRVLQNFNRAER